MKRFHLQFAYTLPHRAKTCRDDNLSVVNQIQIVAGEGPKLVELGFEIMVPGKPPIQRDGFFFDEGRLLRIALLESLAQEYNIGIALRLTPEERKRLLDLHNDWQNRGLE